MRGFSGLAVGSLVPVLSLFRSSLDGGIRTGGKTSGRAGPGKGISNMSQGGRTRQRVGWYPKHGPSMAGHVTFARSTSGGTPGGFSILSIGPAVAALNPAVNRIAAANL